MGRWGGAPVLGWAPWEKAANCGCYGRPLTLFLLLRPHFPSMLLAVMPSVGVGTFVWWPFLPEANLWDETMSWCQAPLSRVQWAWRGQEGLTSTADPGDISLRVVAWGPCSSALASMCIVLQHAHCTAACCGSRPSAGFQCLGQWGLEKSSLRPRDPQPLVVGVALWQRLQARGEAPFCGHW